MRDTTVKVQVQRFHGLAKHLTTLKLAARLAMKPVDVIHAHLSRSARVALPLGALTGTPVVVTAHTNIASEIYARLAARNNRIIAVSNFLRAQMVSWGTPPEAIEVVHNGTEFQNAPTCDRAPILDEFNIPRDSILIGQIGRVAPAKGCIPLVDAMSELAERFPKLHLILVGNEKGEVSEMIRQRVAEKKVCDRVTITGPRQDIVRLIDAFDILAAPSLMETFGLTALEAMARSKPVIATRIGGLPEVIEDGETGILVEPTVEALRDAIAYLVENPHQARAMGINGKVRASTHFSLDRMTSQYEDIYDALCKANPRPTATSKLVKQI